MAKGDLIRAGRVGYYHYGIDVGDGTVVHHFGGIKSAGHQEIRRTSLDEFLEGFIFEKVNLPSASTADEVVNRALSRIGDSDYDLFFNNCEHFAKWCKTGEDQFLLATSQLLDDIDGDPIENMARNAAALTRKIGKAMDDILE